ncbi:MAG: hypothetical protein KKD44_27880 [Proteobacteria bacterium]|nr:hypothetical protein [Pseudomonadota bacterium]
MQMFEENCRRKMQNTDIKLYTLDEFLHDGELGFFWPYVEFSRNCRMWLEIDLQLKCNDERYIPGVVGTCSRDTLKDGTYKVEVHGRSCVLLIWSEPGQVTLRGDKGTFQVPVRYGIVAFEEDIGIYYDACHKKIYRKGERQ